MFRFKSFRLRNQLIILFLILIGFVLTISGFYIDWQSRRVIENEIGYRLKTVAKLAATEVSHTQILNLLPGDENSRTARSLSADLRTFTLHGGISRLLISDRNYRIYYDSAKLLNIGDEYFRMRFDKAEIERVFVDARARASKLFEDNKGALFKAAYAPIKIAGRTQALVCVEGSAAGLLAVQETRSILLTLGLFALVAALLAALFIAHQMTRPIEKLKQATESIAKGEYADPVQVTGSSEVAFLSQMIDDMRKAIAERHQRQQMMLAGIAHEIRNPLGGIELFAGLMQKKAQGEFKQSTDKILSEVQHLKQIVTDFLEYARPVEPQKSNVNLAKSIQDMYALLQDNAANVQWQVEIDASIFVHADPDHLRRILLNLLRNASEALSEQENGLVAMTAQARHKHIQITIQDNGPGISE
ncbi:MAG: histidine kinase dimerization/phospho-acceptor domain-containing protein, partial [bacterium]